MYETARVARRKIENRDFPSDVLTSIDSVVWHRVTGISFTNQKKLVWLGKLNCCYNKTLPYKIENSECISGVKVYVFVLI